MMRFIPNRDSQPLAVYCFGDMNHPALIFSNSLGTDHRMWKSQIDYFAKNYFVICYDTRGHGNSVVSTALELNDLAHDVLDILDALEIKKAHFCGISMGGITGLKLAKIAPERLFTVTIANSAAKIGQTDGWLSRAENVEKQGLDELVTTTHLRWFSPAFDYRHDPVAQTAIQSLSVTSPQGYAASCRALATADLRHDLHSIQVPCLAVCGAFDPITTVQDGEFLETHIPQCELEIIKASHLSNIEAPQTFNLILSDFICKHDLQKS